MNSRTNSWTIFSRISCANLSTKFARIRANSYEFFARKIGYVTNGLYCIIEKLLVSAIDFNSKFENLLTSAGVIAIELCKEYDIIVTSFKFIRIQISSVNVHH